MPRRKLVQSRNKRGIEFDRVDRKAASNQVLRSFHRDRNLLLSSNTSLAPVAGCEPVSEECGEIWMARAICSRHPGSLRKCCPSFCLAIGKEYRKVPRGMPSAVGRSR